MADSDLKRISPTAYYTGAVWENNHLQGARIRNDYGNIMYAMLKPLDSIVESATGVSLEKFLLQRHTFIDNYLSRAITERDIKNVIEFASGLSTRMQRLSRRYPEVQFFETDLTHMIWQKKQLLAEVTRIEKNHRLIALDVSLNEGEESLFGDLSAAIDTSRPTLVICEGLVNYLPREVLMQMWKNLRTLLGGARGAWYLSDIHLEALQDDFWVQTFRRGLELFVRGSVTFHFKDERDLGHALEDAGLRNFQIFAPEEYVDSSLHMRRPSPVRMLEITLSD